MGEVVSFRENDVGKKKRRENRHLVLCVRSLRFPIDAKRTFLNKDATSRSHNHFVSIDFAILKNRNEGIESEPRGKHNSEAHLRADFQVSVLQSLQKPQNILRKVTGRDDHLKGKR